nr:immunoglobulin heavy chain junction region [Mus musculus]
VYFCARGDWEF